MLDENELRATILALLIGVKPEVIIETMFKAVDKACRGYECSNTDVYEEVIKILVGRKIKCTPIKKGETNG